MSERVCLYSGRDLEEANKSIRILHNKGIDYVLGFGDFSRFKEMPFPVVSKGMIDYYGVEAIEKIR